MKEMLELSRESSSKRGLLYVDVFADSLVARDLTKLALSCLRQGKPLIIHNFRGPGGIGKNYTTQTIDGFLKFHEDVGSPAPYCQVEGQPNGYKEWKELREQFKMSPRSCAYNANLLGIPLMNYQNLYTNISFPEFLENVDLLRLVATACSNFEKL